MFCSASFLLGGCCHYADNPPEFTFQGIVIDKEWGEPIDDATVHIYCNRDIRGVVPCDPPGGIISTTSDIDGMYFAAGKVNFPTQISAQTDELFGFVEIENANVDRSHIIIELEPKNQVFQSKLK